MDRRRRCDSGTMEKILDIRTRARPERRQDEHDPAATVRDSRPRDPDILSLAELSQILRCSEDTLRRVPVSQLPVYRIGKANLYLRDDVLRFVRSRRVVRPNADVLIDEVVRDIDGRSPGMITSDPVDVREPSKRRAI